MMAEAILELRQVERHYLQGQKKLTILSGTDFSLVRGEMVALVAPSGAGKSTLLHTAGLLERPDGGDVILGGRACGRLSDDQRTAIRRNDIGFVYQFHHLLGEFSALENVAMPQMIRGLSHKEANARAKDLLSYLGLGARLTHRPSELSGGEQQRVAIARALANDPDLILCDEPTGNLDTKTGTAIMDLLAAENRRGKTVVMVTHDPRIAAYARRTIRIVDGRLV